MHMEIMASKCLNTMWWKERTLMPMFNQEELITNCRLLWVKTSIKIFGKCVPSYLCPLNNLWQFVCVIVVVSSLFALLLVFLSIPHFIQLPESSKMHIPPYLCILLRPPVTPIVTMSFVQIAKRLPSRKREFHRHMVNQTWNFDTKNK